MKTLDQIRASYAWKRLDQDARANSKEYRNLAKSMPALVMTNGLLQALAFLKSKERNDKKRKEYDWLIQDIVGWLGHEEVGVLSGDGLDWEAATQELIGLEPAEYRRATEETLGVLKWIRQFADARGGEE